MPKWKTKSQKFCINLKVKLSGRQTHLKEASRQPVTRRVAKLGTVIFRRFSRVLEGKLASFSVTQLIPLIRSTPFYRFNWAKTLAQLGFSKKFLVAESCMESGGDDQLFNVSAQ
jgi:hypothetical protein